MTIMYLTFGQKTEYHVQAYLSMLSFRRQTAPTDRIVMVTTAPEFTAVQRRGPRSSPSTTVRSVSGKASTTSSGAQRSRP